MDPHSTRSLTFAASPAELFSALREAARRTGFHIVSSDAGAGTATFTSATVMLNFGEKVHTRIVQLAPGTVEITLTSDAALSVNARRGQPGADRMAEVLSELITPVG